MREVRRVAARLRKAAAEALENPTILHALIAGAAHAIDGEDVADWTIPPSKPHKRIDPEAPRFPNLLRKVADAVEEVIKHSGGITHADAQIRLRKGGQDARAAYR